MWSHRADWDDLLVRVPSTDASGLDLGKGWPDRWLVTRRVGGSVRPVLDDRKRQEASAFTWAHVTQGEPRFAPRPIEASQPETIRKDWTGRRGNLWHKLTRPGRFVHYIELRKLLIEYGDRLAIDIGNRRLTSLRPSAEGRRW